MLSTDEGYQPNFEAYVGNFTAEIAASKLGKLNGLFALKPTPWSIRAREISNHLPEKLKVFVDV
jgi:hypothetical protein